MQFFDNLKKFGKRFPNYVKHNPVKGGLMLAGIGLAIAGVVGGAILTAVSPATFGASAAVGLPLLAVSGGFVAGLTIMVGAGVLAVGVTGFMMTTAQKSERRREQNEWLSRHTFTHENRPSGPSSTPPSPTTVDLTRKMAAKPFPSMPFNLEDSTATKKVKITAPSHNPIKRMGAYMGNKLSTLFSSGSEKPKHAVKTNKYEHKSLSSEGVTYRRGRSNGIVL